MFVFQSMGTLCPFCVFVQFVAHTSVVSDYLPSGLNGMNFEYVIRYQVNKHTQTYKDECMHPLTLSQIPEGRSRI